MLCKTLLILWRDISIRDSSLISVLVILNQQLSLDSGALIRAKKGKKKIKTCTLYSHSPILNFFCWEFSMYEVYFVVGEERVLLLQRFLKLGLFFPQSEKEHKPYTHNAGCGSSFKSWRVYFIFLRKGRDRDIFTRLNMLKGANWFLYSTLVWRPFLWWLVVFHPWDFSFAYIFPAHHCWGYTLALKTKRRIQQLLLLPPSSLLKSLHGACIILY